MLHNSDFSQPFELGTDTSGTRSGVMLSQVTGDDQHPILFISCKLIAIEQKYSVVEQGELAV